MSESVNDLKGDLVWGRDELMVVAAFRYCLGRRTYIVSDCVDWLLAHWEVFSDQTRSIIKRDLEEEFARDDAARAGGAGRLTYPLGMDCDRAQWERVRNLWAEPAASE